MNGKLYNWLQKQFYWSNHTKYRKYFEIWVNNFTQAQITGFTHQMERFEKIGLEHL